MPEPMEPIAQRRDRAREVLRLYGGSAVYLDTDGIVTKALTDLRHLVDDDSAYQRLLDASRLDWYRDMLAESPESVVDEGVPRHLVWSRHCEAERMVGDYWPVLPTILKDAVIEACVDAEAGAVRERLAALAADTGFHATWNHQTGRFRVRHDAEMTVAFARTRRLRLLAEAFGTVLDRYRQIEDEQCAAFVAEATARLEARGYKVRADFYDGRAPGDPETNYTQAVPSHQFVQLDLLERNPGPLPQDAAALAGVEALADRLPPLNADPADPVWFRDAYAQQAKAVGGDNLAPEDYMRLLAALADARTAAVNLALMDTGHVWDPRLDFAVSLPNEMPPPLTDEQHAEIAAAKASIDPAAVYRQIFGAPPDPVAAAYPAPAAATGIDTGPDTEPDTPSRAPQPGP